MKKTLSDEQLDNVMRTLVADASADDSMIDDIADSPKLWWAVQRQINEAKSAEKMPWPPVNMFRRWLTIGVPVLTSIALLIGFYAFRPSVKTTETAGGQQDVTTAAKDLQPAVTEPVPPATPILPAADDRKVERNYSSVRATTASLKRSVVRTRNDAAEKRTEIKSEFIALSYARDPESGQIVRVKVPSSMMVTLGLVASVEKPSNLVDAEVVVGDDGLTRAIRFIR